MLSRTGLVLYDGFNFYEFVWYVFLEWVVTGLLFTVVVWGEYFWVYEALNIFFRVCYCYYYIEYIKLENSIFIKIIQYFNKIFTVMLR